MRVGIGKNLLSPLVIVKEIKERSKIVSDNKKILPSVLPPTAVQNIVYANFSSFERIS